MITNYERTSIFFVSLNIVTFNLMLAIYVIKETATFGEDYQFMRAVNCLADVYVNIQLLLDILAPAENI